MKKHFIIVLMLQLATLGVIAQDTLVSSVPPETYFYNSWIDSQRVGIINLPQFVNGRLTGKYFCSGKDTLTVYGIAASLYTYDTDQFLYRNLANHSMDNLYEYLGLLKPEDDTLRWVSDSLLVHLRDTPVSYYYDIDMPVSGYRRISPVYERFFDSPVRICDSFYVGITQLSWAREYDSIQDCYVGPELQLPVLITSYDPVRGFVSGQVVHKVTSYHSVHYYYQKDSVPGRGLEQDAFLFPILAPPDTATGNPTDTTIVDTTTVDTTTVDTVGIATLRTVERYVNLLPNPASERVQVTSSFGLRGIEVYNAAGLKVYGQKATGYATTLDISALPEGSYLVRVATPSGTVTKKLVVQRR